MSYTQLIPVLWNPLLKYVYIGHTPVNMTTDWQLILTKTGNLGVKLANESNQRFCSQPLMYVYFTKLNKNMFKLMYTNNNNKLERAVDGAPSQIPTLKFLTPPAPAVPTRGMTLATEWKFCSIRFLSFFVRTHTKFGINIFEIDMLMIFDLLTSPQGHQFDPRIKMLLAFCSARHPRRFDMLHDHVWKKIVWPPGYPQCLKVPPLGHDPGDRIKIPSDMFFYLSFVRTHIQFGMKIFETDMVTEI